MDLITLEELEEKIKAGESIEKLAKKYWVCFDFKKGYSPRSTPVETLIEIIEKAPELLTTGRNIPVWLFLLLLVREKFDIIDKIVSEIFKREKRIARYQKEENTSNIVVCNILSTIKQVKKEQISVLLSIMEKRKNLFSEYSKDYNTFCLIYYFLEPLKDYLSEECFLPIFNWVNKETGLYFFKNISSEFFEKLPIESPLIQENLAKYFISASVNWIFTFKLAKVDLFTNWDKVKLLDGEFFIPSVVKFFSRLHNFKKVYLLNFLYFLENYPQLVVKSLKALVSCPDSIDVINIDNKIFIPNAIWDIAIKKDPLLFIDLIKNLPDEQFCFDINYVSKKAKLPCFLFPENSAKVRARLKKLRRVFAKTQK